MTPIYERVRKKVEAMLPALPNFDLDCERRMMIEPGVEGTCGRQPTYLLKARRPYTAERKAMRRLYCREHTLNESLLWTPVESGTELDRRLNGD